MSTAQATVYGVLIGTLLSSLCALITGLIMFWATGLRERTVRARDRRTQAARALMAAIGEVERALQAQRDMGVRSRLVNKALSNLTDTAYEELLDAEAEPLYGRVAEFVISVRALEEDSSSAMRADQGAMRTLFRDMRNAVYVYIEGAKVPDRLGNDKRGYLHRRTLRKGVPPPREHNAPAAGQRVESGMPGPRR